MGNGSEVNLGKRRGGAEVGGVEGRETVVEMYYGMKNLFLTIVKIPEAKFWYAGIELKCNHQCGIM